MNGLKKLEDFLGLSTSFPEPVAWIPLAQEIRHRLGEHRYLLDQFLGLMLQGLYDASVTDPVAWSERHRSWFWQMCRAAVAGWEEESCSHLEKNLGDYLAVYSDEELEPETKQALCYAALADVFLQEGMKRYGEEVQQELFSLDLQRMEELYHGIGCQMGETQLLNTFIKSIFDIFQVASAAAVYRQGLQDNLLYTLIQTDGASGKQVFQLLLDRKWEGQEGNSYFNQMKKNAFDD